MNRFSTIARRAGGARAGMVAALFAMAVAGLSACSDTTDTKAASGQDTATVSTAPKAVGPVSSPSVKSVTPGTTMPGSIADQAATAGVSSAESGAGPQPGSAALAAGAPAGTHETAVPQINFQEFTLRSQPVADEDNLVSVTLLHQDKVVSDTGAAFRTVEPQSVLEQFPREDCASREIDMFTGGANCCWGYFLLTSCGGQGYASYIEPYDGGLGDVQTLPGGKAKGYVIGDGAFMYYEPAGQSGSAPLSFARVNSPRVQRFLVFDNGAWRADQPGEFAEGYKSMLAALEGSKDIDPAAKAIMAAYYTLMAGEGATAAEAALAKALPKEYASLATAILADVRKAVAGFRPAQELPLQ